MAHHLGQSRLNQVDSALPVSRYRDALTQHLVPMFPGAELEPSPVSIDVAGLAIQETHTSVLVRPDRRWSQSFRMTRSTGFTADDVQLVRQFVRVFREKLSAYDRPYFGYLIDRCPEDVVAQSTRHRVFDDELSGLLIRILKRWAIETYEGRRIVAALGIEPRPNLSQVSSIHISNLSDKNYAKVLSNGTETLLVVSPSGHVIAHRSVSDETRESTSSGRLLAPRRHRALASWATNGRVAFALNEFGEVLVFKERQLKFAFRNGNWTHFAHSAVLARMEATIALRRAVYVSCLDVSFARTGGCIAIATSTASDPELLHEADLLSTAASEKSRLLKHTVGRQFAALPRDVREEVVALDGATVLDSEGRILAAGAIVHVPAGSDGGGRLAATKALSRLGFAVKISADGGITAFSGHKRSDPVRVFQVGS